MDAVSTLRMLQWLAAYDERRERKGRAAAKGTNAHATWHGARLRLGLGSFLLQVPQKSLVISIILVNARHTDISRR